MSSTSKRQEHIFQMVSSLPSGVFSLNFPKIPLVLFHTLRKAADHILGMIGRLSLGNEWSFVTIYISVPSKIICFAHIPGGCINMTCFCFPGRRSFLTISILECFLTPIIVSLYLNLLPCLNDNSWIVIYITC